MHAGLHNRSHAVKQTYTLYLVTVQFDDVISSEGDLLRAMGSVVKFGDSESVTPAPA